MSLQWNPEIPEQVKNAERFRTPKNLFLKALIFCGVFLLGSLLQSFVIMPKLTEETSQYSYQLLEETGSVTEQQVEDYMMSLLSTEPYVIMQLYSTVAATLIALLFCRLIEKRSLSTMGWTKSGAFPQYLVGLAAGFAMFSGVVGLSWLLGGIEPTQAGALQLSSFLLICGGWALQGMSEEVIFRGYFMTTLLRHHSPVTAVMVSAIGFALAHGGNNGISIPALVNLTLFGVFASVYMLRTGNLWGVCAIHSIWNFVQGNFYGLPVSGMDVGGSVFRFQLCENKDLINGGAFGAEGGIPTTIILLIGIGVMLFVPFGKKKEAQVQA